MSKKVNAIRIQADHLPALPDIRRIPEFLEFVRWYATPSWLREDKTQKEFAERVGVDQDTLSDWKRHPQFWPLVWQIVLERMQGQVPDVLEGLYEKNASGKGGASDVQLFLRLALGEPVKSKKNKNKT